MPQLDKLIILVQFKVFFILFFIVYFLFVLYLLPKVYKSLRLRRKKFESFLLSYNDMRSQQVFSYIEHKTFLSSFLILFELFSNNQLTEKKFIVFCTIDHISKTFSH